jgi:hypothetical protein
MTATPDPVRPFVDAARDYVKRTIGVDLDGSETSLAYVDHYIEKTTKEKLAPDVLRLVAPALGAYFGEVVIARFGGRWVAEGDPAGWRVELDVGGLKLHPVGMAAAALAHDDLDGYDASFTGNPRFTEQLADALASAPPVDEAYFYSLTGRIETLAHAAEILSDLERQSS